MTDESLRKKYGRKRRPDQNPWALRWWDKAIEPAVIVLIFGLVLGVIFLFGFTLYELATAGVAGAGRTLGHVALFTILIPILLAFAVLVVFFLVLSVFMFGSVALIPLIALWSLIRRPALWIMHRIIHADLEIFDGGTP